MEGGTLASNSIPMTDEEKSAMDSLVVFWDRYRNLTDSVPTDVAEMCSLIHQIQALFALRVARRADPEYWRK